MFVEFQGGDQACDKLWRNSNRASTFKPPVPIHGNLDQFRHFGSPKAGNAASPRVRQAYIVRAQARPAAYQERPQLPPAVEIEIVHFEV